MDPSNLAGLYNTLYNESIRKIKSDDYQIDELIDSRTDDRFGVTLLLRQDKEVKAKIRQFLDELKLVEPQQYYYPESDIHMTVMSIISCYSGFKLSSISVEAYTKTIQKSIEGLGSFDIQFTGLTASPSCLMVQGFPKNDTLMQIRNNLRSNFKKSSLEQTIDKRYVLQTAHSTVFRLREKLINKDEFLKLVEEYRDYDFGSFTVESLEFAFTDWYQRKQNVKTLNTFGLH